MRTDIRMQQGVPGRIHKAYITFAQTSRATNPAVNKK
jgi:hypothetical protein